MTADRMTRGDEVGALLNWNADLYRRRHATARAIWDASAAEARPLVGAASGEAEERDRWQNAVRITALSDVLGYVDARAKVGPIHG